MRLVVLVLLLLVVAVPGARADPASYVALGDSYSSGVGAGPYVRDGTACRRSRAAYPALVARSRGLRLDLRACSGATIGDVRRSQLAGLSRSTRYLTISVGGNDAGFTRVLTACAKPWWLAHCGREIDRARAVIDQALPGALHRLYDDLRTRAPNARVVVVGYPRLFAGEDCDAGTFFSPGEQARLNRTADRLDQVLAAAARAQGFAFADPTRTFLGHALCEPAPWLHGLSRPLAESFHPNRAGHAQGLAPLVGSLLR
ncbi:MAG: SGNH/GDSL hydrolase family protein [Nocardioidaceae bacterium]|nr:SGNH/GDSL hydrolase family protein [Nocardioidaceae bacterium]